MPTEMLTATPPATTTVDQWVLRVAGLFVLLSVALSQVHSSHWLWFTAFVGANMLQASFTGLCPLAKILERLGVPSGAAFCVAPRRH
jgi:Inner membrane protein YgaP-like, transmembrane domain